MRIKFWTFFVLTFFVKFSLGQVYQAMPQYGYGPVKRFDVDSTLTIPTVCGVPTLKSNIVRKSAIAFDTCNNRFYFYNSKTLIWDTIKSGAGTTIDTTNRFVSSVTKLNDSTIRVIKGTTTSDISITTATNSTRLITKVWNKSGATITKGSVVYIDGAHSSILPSIALAKANAESTSAYTYGLVIDDIPDNSEGTVIQNGAITNLNLPTNTYTDGQTLYLSPTVAGGYTLTKPLAPNHYVAIGTITRAHPNFGTIQVAIRNGYQLDELSDVQISSVPADSTLLQFSRVDSLWHDVSPTTAIGNRYIKPSDTVSLSNRINLKLNSSDSTIYFTKYRSDTMRTNVYSAINGKQASGTYLTDDPVVLGQQAMGSTIKGVGLSCRTLRDMVGGQQMVNQTLYMTAYYLTQATTLTGIKFFQQVQGVYTASNENRFGLYTYSNGVLTLVASTTNNGNLWKGTTGTFIAEPFSSTYTAAAGLYFIGGLWSSSGTTTFPQMGHGGTKILANVANGDFTNTSRFTCTLTSQTSLPSSITLSTTTAVAINVAFFLY